VQEERVVLMMNEESLKLIFSSNTEGTASGKPIVNLVEDTTLGVRKMLQKGTLNKIRVVREGNHTSALKEREHQPVLETKESRAESPLLDEENTTTIRINKKNKRNTKTHHNPFL